MVAVVAGNGLGLFNTSLSILGSTGVSGQSVLGQAGARSFVNVATGNLVLQMQDEWLSGRGSDLQHVRTYNSLGDLIDPDGDGWRWGYEQTVRLSAGAINGAGSQVTRTDGDGHETVWSWNGTRYVSTEGSGAHDTLVHNSVTQTWEWTEGTTRLVETYATMTGRLIKRTDISGNSITFTHDSAGRLTSARDTASQQELQLTYAQFGAQTLLQKIETRALNDNGTLGNFIKQVEYGYTNGRLTLLKTDLTPGDTADDADPAKSYVTQYTYNPEGRVASITQSDGTSVFFTYYDEGDDDGKIKTVTDNSSSMAPVQLMFTYGDNVTTVKDGNGQDWEYSYHGTSGQLTEILSPAPTVGGASLSTKFEYDASGNVLSITDANNNRVIYRYDGNGNRILEQDALGNTVTRTFDAQNQVVTETRCKTPDTDGNPDTVTASNPLTTRYVYDSSSRLRFVVSAEGRVTENRYGTSGSASGLLIYTLQYTGSVYDLSGLPSETTPLTLAQLDSWVNAPTRDKTKVQITQLDYDLRGNVSRQTSYATVAANGAGVPANTDPAATVTEFVYDPHGQLVQTIVVRGADRALPTILTSYAYDGLGRMSSSTGGGVTQNTVYRGAQPQIQVTNDATGLVELRSFDARGRLVSVSRTGDGVTRATRYVYDNADRLRMTEDALGARRFSFYDAAGRLVYTVDSSGAVTGFEYRASGQLEKQTLFVDRIEQPIMTSWYNQASNTVTKPSLTVGVDFTADPRDRITTFGYDAAGRLTTATDAANVVTTTSYDGLSRVTMTQSGDRVTRYLYDKDGRKTGMVDALGYLTEYKYDAGGRLTETIRYSERSPGITNVAAPAWIGVTNQTATGGRFFEYRAPAFDADGDSLTFSIVGTLPAWLTFDPSTATLKGTPPTTLTDYNVTLRAADGRGKTSDVTVRISVTNSAPTWSDLPDHTVVPTPTTGWSLTLPAATDNGAATQLTYSFRSPLPPGVTFDAAQRKLTGQPMQPLPGMYTLTARVTDAQGQSVDKSFTLTVAGDWVPDWTPIAWAPMHVQDLRASQPFSLTVPAARHPQGAALTYSVISKPSWLQFNAATRVLSGTPPVSASFETVTLLVRGPGSAPGLTLSFGVNVRSDNPVWAALPPLDALVDGTVNYTPPAAQDPEGQALTYSVVGGLPAGLSIDAATGRISGTPRTAGFYTITLRATDPRGMSVDATVSLQVRSATSAPVQSPGSDALAQWRPTNTSGLRSYLYYDGQGRVIGAVDERGFLSETVYNDAGNSQQSIRYMTAVAVTAGATLASLRSAAGQAQTTTTQYDDLGRVFQINGFDHVTTRVEYDAAGRLMREVRDAGGTQERATRTRYNAFGEITGTLGGVGNATLGANPTQQAIDTAIETFGLRYEYDSLGRKRRVIDANDHVTLFFYDSENRLTHTVNGEREVSVTEYDAFGQVFSTRRYAIWMTPENFASLTGGPVSQLQGKLPPTSPEDAVTTYTYDSRGLLVRQTDGEGFASTRHYDAYGQLAAEIRTILNGKTTTTQFDYDLRGAVLAQTSDVGGINLNVQSVYDAFGRVIRSVDAAGKVTTTRYLDSGRVIEVTDPLDRKVRSEYDARNRVLKQIDALGQATIYTYDDEARTLQVLTPEGLQVSTFNNAHGQVYAVSNSLGGTTSFEHDKDGQLIKVKDALGRTITRNEYDASGRLFRTTDARGTVTELTYDAVNRVFERRVDPTGLNLRTQYRFDDGVGRQVDVTEAAGTGAARVTRYIYDRNGRLHTQTLDPTGLQLSTRYSYDGLGNTVKVERGTLNEPKQQVTLYEFDSLGRRSKEIAAPTSEVGAGAPGARDLTTQYRYDTAGRVSRRIDADGNSTWYVYDAAGQLSYTINGLGEVSQTQYDANGRLSHTRRYLTRLAPNVVAGFGDVLGAFTPPAAHGNDQRSYSVYDKDGRVRFTVQADITNNWTIADNRYDLAGNLIESRRYDKFLLEARINALDTAQSPGLSVMEVTTELADLGYVDESSTLKDVQRTRFAYDANNRLRFTIDALGSVTENVYDGAGSVVKTVRYAVRPALSAYDESTIDDAVDRDEPGNQVSAFAYDAVGRLRFSVRVLASNEQGQSTQDLVTEHVYDALGQLLQRTSFARDVNLMGDYSAANIASTIVSDPKDRRSASAYDAAGRLVYSVRVLSAGASGQHLVSRMEYDALGRISKSTSYASPIGLADFSKATLDTATAAIADNPGNRTTELMYDAAGRQRFAVNADGALSETVYDALGQVTETRRFDLRVDAQTARTEAALSELRAQRAVGDGDAVTRGEKYTYDRAGRVLTTTDAHGNADVNVYNGLGDRTSYTNRNGATWTYEYDRQGRVFREIAPAVMVQLRGETAPTSRALETRFYRDAFGLLRKRVEANGTTDARTTEHLYDTLGRLVHTVLDGWYDPTTGRVESSSATGRFKREVQLTHDTLGNVVRTRTRTGISTFQYEYKTYDVLGRLVHDVDALSHVTSFTYTPFDEQRTVTRHSSVIAGAPDNGSHWTTAEIDAQVVDDTAARAITTSYDQLGRKIEVKQDTGSYYFNNPGPGFNPLGAQTLFAAPTTEYEYNAFGEVHRERARIDEHNWRETWHYYDKMGRETRTIQELRAGREPGDRATGYHTEQTYDASGNLKLRVEYAVLAAAGASGEFTPPAAPPEAADDRIIGYDYDALNRRTKTQRFNLLIADELGNLIPRSRLMPFIAEVVQYDNVGKTKLVGDGSGRNTLFEYNALGQTTKVTAPSRTAVAAGTVDPFRNQVLASPVTTLTLDAFGNVVTTESDPGTAAGGVRRTHQSYDAAGNAISSTDAKGAVKHRQYDYAGRVIGETQDISVFLGHELGGFNNHTLERRYFYDASGRQIAVLDAYPDGSGRQQSGQRSLFNAFGEVEEELRVWGAYTTALSDLNTAKVATYTYDSSGHLTSKTAADGITQHFYNLLGQVTRQEQRGNFADSDGTSTRITETAYDRMGRATTQRLPRFMAYVPVGHNSMAAKDATPLATQVYDRWGNVTERYTGGFTALNGEFDNSQQTVTTYAYNHDNQVTAERLPRSAARRADGSFYETFVTHETRYDIRGRVVREQDVVDNAATPQNEATFLRGRSRQYDRAGNLISQTDAEGFTTLYAYDAHGNRVGTKDALGTVFVDTFDLNGNHVQHSVLRNTSSGTQFARVLTEHSYDQANRRFSTVERLEVGGHGTMTKHDERNLVRAHRDTSGAITTYGYDAFGNKIRETDALGNVQTWVYSDANDRTVGRLLSSTVDGRTTTYEYNDFGQVTKEDYAGGSNERRYFYHWNGRVQRIDDVSTVGTPLASGGADYLFANDSTRYDYTVKGELAHERFTRSGEQDVRKFSLSQGGWYYELEDLSPITRTTYTKYDTHGRMATVWTAPTTADHNGHRLTELDYNYDELGNIRHIGGSYQLVGSSQSMPIDHWFTYDNEGRMTIADGALPNGQVVAGETGTKISYDALGRRRTIEKYLGTGFYTYDPNPNNDLPDWTDYRWNEYRVESYEYDDLGHLRILWQKLSYRNTEEDVASRGLGWMPAPVFDHDTSFYFAEERVTDLRGFVESRKTYSELRTAENTLQEITGAPLHETTTTSTYRSDGQLGSQSTMNHLDSTHQTDSQLTFVYDATGRLERYFYHQGVVGTPQEFVDTYEYGYSMETGGRKEKTITVTRQGGNPDTKPGNTTNLYDSRGRLQKTVIENSRESTTRTLSYDSSDRIFVVRQSGYGINGTPQAGAQEQFFAHGRQVGTLGTGSLAAARFSFAYTPISAGNQNPSTHVVRAGDTLAAIARAVYGDSALWYLIADANSLGFGPDQSLPSVEIGKSYRIPNVVGNRNNAGTFKPYNSADIIGNTKPSPGLPLAPDQCSGTARVLATVVMVAVTMVVSTLVTAATAYAGPVVSRGLGSAAGNLAGQVTGWGLQLQDGIDWKQVGVAGAQGVIAAGVPKLIKGTDMGARLARAGTINVANQIVSQAANNFEGWSSEAGARSGLFNLGLSLADEAWGDKLDNLVPHDDTQPHFSLSGAAVQMANAAFNPQSGWLFNDRSRDWANIATQAASALTGVMVGAGISYVQTQWRLSQNGASLNASNAQFAAGGGPRQTWLDYSEMFVADEKPLDPEAETASLLEHRSKREILSWWDGYNEWEALMQRAHGWGLDERDAARAALPEYIQRVVFPEKFAVPTEHPDTTCYVEVDTPEADAADTFDQAAWTYRQIMWERSLPAHQQEFAIAQVIAEAHDLSVEQVLAGEHEPGFWEGAVRGVLEPLALARDGFIGVHGEDNLYSNYSRNLKINRGIRELQGYSDGGWAEVKMIATQVLTSASGVNPYSAAAMLSYTTADAISTGIENGGLTDGQWGNIAGGVLLGGARSYAFAKAPTIHLTKQSAGGPYRAAVDEFQQSQSGPAGTFRDAGIRLKFASAYDELRSPLLNPEGGLVNCWWIAKSADRGLSTGDFAAVGNVLPPTFMPLDMAEMLGRTGTPVRIYILPSRAQNAVHLADDLAGLGHGAKGVVVGRREIDGVKLAHAWNVVNYRNDLYHIQGQSGHVSSPDQFKMQLMDWDELYFLQTDPLKFWVPGALLSDVSPPPPPVTTVYELSPNGDWIQKF